MSSLFAEEFEVLRDELEDDSTPPEEIFVSHVDVDSDDEGEQEGGGSRLQRSESVGLEAVRASDIQPEAVEWLWQERIPIGALTVLSGDPGLGKSLLTCDLAAGLSRGELTGVPAHTLLITAERAGDDSPAEVGGSRSRLEPGASRPSYGQRPVLVTRW